MSRFARHRRVFYWEEPIYDGLSPTLDVRTCESSAVTVITPHLPEYRRHESAGLLQELLSRFARNHGISEPIVWFYTPMALEFFPDTLTPSMVIYDCMDELSMFRGAPPELQVNETRLIQMADLVFTGGASLFEAKRELHPRVHVFPSGVDADHFRRARNRNGEYAEQAGLPRPRLGYAGVIDERIDLPLIEDVARRRPDWQLIMIGPVAKIDPASLPRLSNISWLGMKPYNDLPKYFAGWDAALMPFAMNDSTRFISPTKTPEYLCAGLPVISTPIRDVVRPYGELGLVRIAKTPEHFVESAEQAMMTGMCLKWRERADQFLETLSWESVWTGMNTQIANHLCPPTSSAPFAAASQETTLRV